jgi:hypothetical protein
MEKEPLLIVLGIVIFAIWLLTFGIVWWLIGIGLFISCVVLLFSDAIGPALGCLILCPIAWFIGYVIMEAKDRHRERERRYAEFAARPPASTYRAPEYTEHDDEEDVATMPESTKP